MKHGIDLLVQLSADPDQFSVIRQVRSTSPALALYPSLQLYPAVLFNVVLVHVTVDSMPCGGLPQSGTTVTAGKTSHSTVAPSLNLF